MKTLLIILLSCTSCGGKCVTEFEQDHEHAAQGGMGGQPVEPDPTGGQGGSPEGTGGTRTVTLDSSLVEYPAPGIPCEPDIDPPDGTSSICLWQIPILVTEGSTCWILRDRLTCEIDQMGIACTGALWNENDHCEPSAYDGEDAACCTVEY